MRVVVCLFLFLFLGGQEFVTGKDTLPESFQRCSHNDPKFNDCLRGAIEDSFRKIKDGLPAFHMLPVDPIDITAIEIQQGAGRPVNIKLILSNAKGHGFSTINVLNVKSDLEKGIIEINGVMQTAYLEADYDMDGKFLVLPMKGNGKCRFDFTGTKATLKLTAKPKTKNGKQYWDVKDFKVYVRDLDKLQVNFDNLFNGDKRLGDNTNKVLNENWKGFWEELKPAFEDTFAQIFVQLSKLIFDKVPINEIFLE